MARNPVHPSTHPSAQALAMSAHAYVVPLTTHSTTALRPLSSLPEGGRRSVMAMEAGDNSRSAPVVASPNKQGLVGRRGLLAGGALALPFVPLGQAAVAASGGACV